MVEHSPKIQASEDKATTTDQTVVRRLEEDGVFGLDDCPTHGLVEGHTRNDR